MMINGIILGGEINKRILDMIRDFKLLQLKITKCPGGTGIIEVKGTIDEEKMSLLENILSEY